MASRSTEGTHSTTFHHLDDFSLLSILDWLSLRALVNIASLGPRYKELISHHYINEKYRVSECDVSLSVDRAMSIDITCGGDSGKVQKLADGYGETMRTLMHFCSDFNHLKIQLNEREDYLVSKLSYYVNQYCGDIHQTIEIDRGHRLVHWKELTLMNVTDVKIIRPRGGHLMDEFRIDLSFPRMEKMDIDYPMDIIHHYPHLTEFLFQSYLQRPIDFIDFMQLNPQLRMVQVPLSFNNFTFLTTMNKLLPNLESLTLQLRNGYRANSDENEIIRFTKVRAFAFDLFYDTIVSEHLLRTSIQFDRLDSFEVRVYNHNAGSFGFLIEWITSYSELSKVTFTTEQELSNHQLTALIAPLTQLKELTISWHRSAFDVLHRFLSDSVTMKSSLERINIFFALLQMA